jgi:hypothetical protein
MIEYLLKIIFQENHLLFVFRTKTYIPMIIFMQV